MLEAINNFEEDDATEKLLEIAVERAVAAWPDASEGRVRSVLSSCATYHKRWYCRDVNLVYKASKLRKDTVDAVKATGAESFIAECAGNMVTLYAAYLC